jgi:hydrogenase nickel incorporation protein HypA/HybF
MHELGIVFYIVDEVKKVAKENNAKKVLEVTLELGEVSSVIPSYFMDLWQWTIKKHEILKDCKMNLVELKALSYCEDCKNTYSTVEHGRTCPYCNSPHTYLVCGNEINLKDIKVV